MLRNRLLATSLMAFSAAAWANVTNLAYDGKTVSFAVTGTDRITVEAVTADGEHRAMVYAGQPASGYHTVAWNRTDDAGEPLAAGKYALVASSGWKVTRDSQFADAGRLQLANPLCVRSDAKGDLYVVEHGMAGPAYGGGAWNARLRKFHPNGSPAADFFRWYGARPDEPKVDFIQLPVYASWVELLGGDTLLVNQQNHILTIANPTGKHGATFAGYQWLIDGEGNRTARAGSAWSIYGLAAGRGNAVYIRDRHAIRAYDRTRPGFDGYLYSSAEDLDYPPARLVQVGPCIATDRYRRIFVTSQSGLTRYTDDGTKIERKYSAAGPFKECMGLAVAPSGLVYVVDRGVIVDATTIRSKPPLQMAGRLYAFWDNGGELVCVWQMEDKDLIGAHDIACSPDSKALYVLEDADNYGRRFMTYPPPGLQGKGRMFKYNVTAAHETRKAFTVE